MRARKFLAVSLTLLLASPSWAVKHIKPGAYPKAFHDQIHHPSAAQIKQFGSLRAAIIGSSSGTKNVAVIFVQFPPGNGTLISGSNSLLHMTDGTDDATFQKMVQYYTEVSYGKLTINFKFFGQGSTLPSGSGSAAAAAPGFTLAHPMEWYGCGDEGEGCGPGVPTPTGAGTVSANGDYLIHDALTAAIAKTGGPLTTGGSPFDAVIVMHAGNGNETTTGHNGDIWSIFYSQDSEIQSAGAGFDEGDVDPETESGGITSPLGVMCHEFGHELGLPDLYNTGVNGGNSVVGNWEIMDSGPFVGVPFVNAGANPSHMGAWDKVNLGWATPQVVTQTGSAAIGYTETNVSGMLKLPVKNGLPQEYVLVEYRSQTSGALFDQKIPGTGLLVWHIDDGITSTRGIGATDPTLVNTVNTGIPHYGVSIITADGLAISDANQGDAGNAFSNGKILTNPSNFSGQPSGITLVNIRGVGSSVAMMDYANLALTPTENISKVINYPNPAGKGYPHPSGEGHTTLQFQLTRPAQSYSINIYTVSGDLVRQISQDDITLNVNRSGDDKWVYEYDWDLKNGNGAMVMPGLYIYLIRADGLHQSNKAVIIR